MNDERLYANVVSELSAAPPMAGLWAKAFAESGGNEQSAKALYLRLRVAQLLAEEIAVHQSQLDATREAEFALAEQEAEARRQERSVGDEVLFSTGRWLLIFFLVVVLFWFIVDFSLKKS